MQVAVKADQSEGWSGPFAGQLRALGGSGDPRAYRLSLAFAGVRRRPCGRLEVEHLPPGLRERGALRQRLGVEGGDERGELLERIERLLIIADGQARLAGRAGHLGRLIVAADEDRVGYAARMGTGEEFGGESAERIPHDRDRFAPAEVVEHGQRVGDHVLERPRERGRRGRHDPAGRIGDDLVACGRQRFLHRPPRVDRLAGSTDKENARRGSALGGAGSAVIPGVLVL